VKRAKEKIPKTLLEVRKPEKRKGRKKTKNKKVNADTKFFYHPR